MEKHRMGQNVEWKNIEWDKMLNEKTPNGTNVERKNIEWDKMSNGNIFGFLFITLLCIVNQAILAWSA